MDDKIHQYLNLEIPLDRALKDMTEEEWVGVAIRNGWRYSGGDEVRQRFWYRDVIRFLRKKLLKGEVVYIGTGKMEPVFSFSSEKSD